jgi:hypothetical protein
MAQCPPDLLDDLAAELAAVRRWAYVAERAPNVFYVRRQPFLHFHVMADGRRRADIKTAAGWKSLYLRYPLPPASRERLLRRLARCHVEKAAGGPTPPAARTRPRAASPRRRAGRRAGS